MDIHDKSRIVGSRQSTEASKATSIQKSVITPAPLHSSTYFCFLRSLYSLTAKGGGGGGTETEESEGRRQGEERLDGGREGERERERGVTDSATDFLIRHAVSECQCVNL